MSKSIEGEYYLQNVREMASGFLLKPDQTFQFFITYGALDRYSSGKWKQKDATLILNSAPRPLSDFALVSSRQSENDFINIIVDHENPMLLANIYASLESGAEGTWEKMNQHGNVQFPLREVEKISLQVEFCPERYSVIPITAATHNEFVFRPEPWLMEVFLDDFELSVGEDALYGRHPLLEGDRFEYVRQR